MNSYYKLTDGNGYTRRGKTGETHWEVGETITPTGEGIAPCGPGVLHLYGSPEEAVLYDPIHADIGRGARLFRVETTSQPATDGLKWWTTESVTVAEELDLPIITTEGRVAWAICIAPHTSTREWAIGWLSGADRSENAANEAKAWSAECAAVASADASSPATFPQHSLSALARGRDILAGKMPADQYDTEAQ